MTKPTLVLIALFFAANSQAAGKKVQQVNNDIISIDGQYAERTMTGSERLKARREKLEKITEQNLKKQIERLRFQQELELSKKIQKTFNERMSALDAAFAEDDDTEANL